MVVRRTGDFSSAMYLIQRMTIHALHACTEMNIRHQAVLLGAVNSGGLMSLHHWRSEAAVEIFFEQPDVICSDVVGVVAFQARSNPGIPNQRVGTRLSVAAIRVSNVACRASEAAMFPPTFRTFGVKVASQT